MRLKILNGAPLCEHLDFSPDALLDIEVVGKALYRDPKRSAIDGSTAPPAKWRRLASKGTRPQTGFSQPYLPRGAFHGSNPDLSFSVLNNIEDTSELPSDDTLNMDTTLFQSEIEGFVEHSLVFHDTLLSSQINVTVDDAGDRTVSSQSFLGNSFASIRSDQESKSQTHPDTQGGPILQVPSTLTLTSLASLPSAAHLRSIYPQTPTPNILCVLSTPPEDREIFVKKGGYRMNLREITVADDTRSSGFKISFWFRPSPKDNNNLQNILINTIGRAKVGDILLLRNIALNHWRDNVDGQSLNPSITRVKTTAQILMSGDGAISNRQLGALPAPVVERFVKVKRWAQKHVAPDSRKRKQLEELRRPGKRSRRGEDALEECLPPNTMESV
jgi:hypothetical protein